MYYNNNISNKKVPEKSLHFLQAVSDRRCINNNNNNEEKENIFKTHIPRRKKCFSLSFVTNKQKYQYV